MAKVACPWGKKNTCEVKFSDIMDEEYAKQLEEHDGSEEYAKLLKEIEEINSVSQRTGEINLADNTDNDLLLAQVLQQEFDKENDGYVKSLEKNYNGSNKVSMSFKNFFSQHPYDTATLAELENFDEGSDDDEFDEELDMRKPTGKVKHGNEIITKHDSIINERKNAKNVEQFPSTFQAGDLRDKDIRIPNRVYNKLKVHSMKEEKGDMRVHEKKEHSTHEKALDEHTRLILYKMVNNGTLDSLSGVIATGKESVVIHAKGGGTEEGPLPDECAIKVYKTTLSEFKTRERYIKEDHRFKDRFSKQNPRKIIRLWAEKEYRNLKRMEEAGISCPKVILLRKHVLLMSFIGTDRVPARKLKYARLTLSQTTQAYLQCIETMKKLYEECNLIHADFSEYNVLWHDSKCVFIDVSQSVEPSHPHAYHFLLRDCRNVTRFFSKCNVSDVMKEEELFQYVCGKCLGETNLDEIENECKETFEANEERLTYGIDSKNFAFDYHFKQSEHSRSVGGADENTENCHSGYIPTNDKET